MNKTKMITVAVMAVFAAIMFVGPIALNSVVALPHDGHDGHDGHGCHGHHGHHCHPHHPHCSKIDPGHNIHCRGHHPH
jgi:hypothetical protein